jgi:hypothetical protein
MLLRSFTRQDAAVQCLIATNEASLKQLRTSVDLYKPPTLTEEVRAELSQLSH